VAGQPSAAERSYLSVREWARHRHYSNRALPWIKIHVERLDDDELTGLPTATRLFADLVLLLAARMDNLIPNDPRRIAGWVAMRPRDVAVAVPQLTACRYLDVTLGTLWRDSGVVQPQLPLRSDAGLHDDPASDPLALARARALAEKQSRAEKDLSTKAEQRLRVDAPALPSDTNLNGKGPEILGRIVRLVCKGDEPSAAIVRGEAAGMPEAVLARALESYMGRRPRPANPAGYIVNAIRSIAAEQGIVRERPTIEREPKL
jgi:hypothetical protein